MSAREVPGAFSEPVAPFEDIIIDARCESLIEEIRNYSFAPTPPPAHLVRGRAAPAMIRIDVRRLALG